MEKVKLTGGESLLFDDMVSRPDYRIQEDMLGGESLRYGLIRLDGFGGAKLVRMLSNEDVFGLMGYGVIEEDVRVSVGSLWQSMIWRLSELSKVLVRSDGTGNG